jgi:hypothetical protein
MGSITIATWNLERPRLASWKKLPAIRAQIATVAADLWVLTESRTTISPGDRFLAVHSPPDPFRDLDSDERWCSVWSRWPMTRIATRDTPWSAAALVRSPLGDLIVYGTVLPYHAEPARASGVGNRQWGEFFREVQLQAEDWEHLRRDFPGIPLAVAGDLNQNLDGARWYGTKSTRQALLDALRGADLRCVTAEDMVASGKLRRNHLVDHVCVTGDLNRESLMCWEPVASDRTRMSDHPGVLVRLARSASQ